jgi:hypothetical protein
MLGHSHHSSVDEAETKCLILLVELQNARITLLRKIRDKESTLDEALIEEFLCAETQPLPQEVVDFRDYRRWHDEASHLSFDELSGGAMPIVAAVVVGAIGCLRRIASSLSRISKSASR